MATLLAARGKDLRSETQIREFVEKQLPFQSGHTYGGNTPCLNIETGSEDYLIIDGGSGIRALGKEIVESGMSGKTFIFSFPTFITTIFKEFLFSAPLIYPEIK